MNGSLKIRVFERSPGKTINRMAELEKLFLDNPLQEDASEES